MSTCRLTLKMSRNEWASGQLRCLRINPGFSVNWARDNIPFKNQADMDRYVSGMRTVGLTALLSPESIEQHTG
jgi:hypothetical protein